MPSVPVSMSRLVELDREQPVWERCFMVAPLVLIGSRDDDGSLDLAPKHMAMPMGWDNYFGFVCSPRHRTCSNIARSGEFTVSYPKPSQVLYASLAASPRYADGPKSVLGAFDTFDARQVDGEFIEDAYLFLECKHYKTIDGFGDNCLITGEVLAAYADQDYLRATEVDEQELIHEHPLIAYLPPSRFATITRSNAFPFPADMKR
ncbi:MAG: flavin reductase [Gammaproteobacteria bacterium]|nr:flavin reductase [Gammaproteobacteria bacterium]